MTKWELVYAFAPIKAALNYFYDMHRALDINANKLSNPSIEIKVLEILSSTNGTLLCLLQ